MNKKYLIIGIIAIVIIYFFFFSTTEIKSIEEIVKDINRIARPVGRRESTVSNTDIYNYNNNNVLKIV
jgi:hypothetical protein